jgi:hypothetical protein
VVRRERGKKVCARVARDTLLGGRSSAALGDMSSVVRRRLLLAWSLAGVPLLFAFFIHLAYRIALSRGELPFLNGHEWRWWTAFGLLLCSGAACIFDASSSYVSHRSLAVLGYFVVMAITLLLVAMSVSCLNGDCL